MKAAWSPHELEYGEEPHHIAEALFKCFARALDAAKSGLTLGLTVASLQLRDPF